MYIIDELQPSRTNFTKNNASGKISDQALFIDMVEEGTCFKRLQSFKELYFHVWSKGGRSGVQQAPR